MNLLTSLVALIVIVALSLSPVQAHSLHRNPLRSVAIVEEPVIHTPSHRATFGSSFELTFYVQNRQRFIRITLQPNHDVIADGATIQYLKPDGTLSRTEVIDRAAHKVYKGQAWVQKYAGAEWTNTGWARMTLYEDGIHPLFEGAFLVEGDHHHVQMNSHYLQTKHVGDPSMPASTTEYMVLWRDSDIQADEEIHKDLRRAYVQESTCSSDLLSFNNQANHPIFAPRGKRDQSSWGAMSKNLLFGRQSDTPSGSGNGAAASLQSSIGSTAGCFNTRRVALMGVATDCTYTAALGNSSNARANVINQIGLASVQYENSFNISLGLRNLTISDASCPTTASTATPWNVACSDSTTINDRLNLFSAWRGGLNDTVNAYWTLLSTCNTGNAVGLAWLGQVCQNTANTNANETVSSANVVVRTSTEWQVIAHESGHTFGAVHDCDSTTCASATAVSSNQCCPLAVNTCDAQGKFIMNPATGPGITQFSACTVGNICSAIGRQSVNTNCLTANKNIQTVSESQCGNGIVEAGEDCDCGGTSGCGNNACCDPTTCKFTQNASCDPSNEDCCTSTCQLASNGTICRASTGSCDPAETCTGTSAICPVNLNAPDGTSCGNDTSLTCASGQCTSRNAQCQTLMGSLADDQSTYACDANTCQISCASSAFPANTCYTMQSNFLDGTPCGGGGHCANGACQGSSVGGQITNWVNGNRTLVIGLAAGIGGFFLLVLLSCCINCCRRRRRLAKIPYPPQSAPPGWREPPPPPPPPPGWRAPPPPPPPPMEWTGQYPFVQKPARSQPSTRDYSGRWTPDGRWHDEPPPVYASSSVRYA